LNNNQFIRFFTEIAFILLKYVIANLMFRNFKVIVVGYFGLWGWCFVDERNFFWRRICSFQI